MSKFTRSTGKGGVAKINTASLPDIVFMLLFFFMTTTVMREVELKIGVTVPEATQGKKLEKKSLASFVYIGEPLPNLRSTFGSEPKIQLKRLPIFRTLSLRKGNSLMSLIKQRCLFHSRLTERQKCL